MGKGGHSESKTQNTNTNINGTNAVQGDNLGVLISGVQGSVGNITLTDQGAIKAAANTAQAAIKSNTDVAKSAFGFGEESFKSALDSVKNIASQSNENARAAITMAGNAKTYEQTGSATTVTRMIYVVGGVLALAAIAYALKGKKL